jgi:hypothetical protein
MVILMKKLNFSYSDILKMKIRKIKIYFLKALEILEAEEKALKETDT